MIELLVVVAIIGILAAIAIPQFSSYRQRGYNAIAMQDLRNGITAQEAVYVESDSYISCANALACETSLAGFRATLVNGASQMTTFEFTGGANSFSGTAAHSAGNETYTYDSTVSGSISASN